MELNTQIWGDNTEWTLDTDTFSATNSPYPAYTGKYKYLKDYRAAQVFDFGAEIDNTILYCGQAAEVSPLGGAAAFYYNENFEGTPEPYIQRNETVSTFLASIGDSQTYNTGAAASTAAGALTTILYYKGAVNGGINTRWIVDGGEYITGGDDWYNVADMTAPIVDFNPKCLFGVIYVVAGNENDGVSTMTLHQLETGNYSNYKIYRAFMRASTVDTVSGSAPYTTSFAETYSSSLTPNKKGLGIIDFTPWKMEDKDYVNYIQNGKRISAYPSIPLFGFDLAVVNLYHYNKFGFSWRSYHYVSDGAERDWAAVFSQAPIFYGATYATFTDVYANKDTSYTDVSFIGYMENTAENRENLRKMAACYGIYFTDYNAVDDSTLFTEDNRYTNEHMCLGLLRDGVGYGDYTHGAGNVDNPAYNWTSSHQSGYDPTKNVDPNTYSDTTNFNTLSLKQAFTRRYALTSSEVQMLAGKLWDANATKDPNITMNEFTLDEYLTNNPIDCIVSLKYFPCKFFTDSALPVTPLYLGKYNTNMLVYGVDKEVRVIDFAPINVYRHFGDFRDFEPYTQIQMYIPFCGTVSIPCAEAMGKYVAVKLVVDVSTGAASGFVLVSNSGSGGICVATATGTAAIDLPVSGLQSANLSQAIFNATANWTQTQISNGKIGGGLLAQSDSFIGTIARGYSKSLGSGIANSAVSLSRGNLSSGVGILSALDPAKAIETGLKTDLENARAKYDLTHVEMPMRLIGSASPMLSAVLETVCRLVIYRPRTDENALSSYANTVGYACCKSGVVSDFSGFTVGTIDVSGINATQEEKAAIAAAFASGVYL